MFWRYLNETSWNESFKTSPSNIISCREDFDKTAFSNRKRFTRHPSPAICAICLLAVGGEAGSRRWARRRQPTLPRRGTPARTAARGGTARVWAAPALPPPAPFSPLIQERRRRPEFRPLFSWGSVGISAPARLGSGRKCGSRSCKQALHEQNFSFWKKYPQEVGSRGHTWGNHTNVIPSQERPSRREDLTSHTLFRTYVNFA